ncbi:unnamed protein product [Spirodela intermedia]|uniref:Glycine cleavage system H protein n=1 Tax=Spirodela intermedia TaxID=51605 RepID=A0A7I8JVW7_SPIIN|nr:unnamed protein product [Spirodela intermedia]CAA6673793.1 unnamed protein product [Spirodela intermedia]
MAMRLWASSMANALGVSLLEGLKYSASHEWVKNDGGVATVGITDHAQDHLGDVVFVELTEPGAAVSKGDSFGSVESVKATSSVDSPVSGEIVEINTKLKETPGLVNSSPYEDGWMIKVKLSDPSELDSLLDPAKYTEHCEAEDAAH